MKTELHIMLIEDNPGDADLIREMLPEAGDVSFRIEQLSRLSDGLARLNSGGIDLVLLDLGLPDSQGLDTFRKLIETWPDKPVIVLTGNNDQKCAVAAVKEGAQDFLVKGQIGEGVLERAIMYAVGRKQAEEALRISEERFRVMFDQAPLGYQSLDEEGCFIVVNKAWLDTLGYSSEEVIGRWFGDFIAPDFADAFRARFPLFKAAGHIHSEFRMLHKNGSQRFIAFEGRIGYKPDGSFKQTHCILSDITERRRAEERLRETERQLSTTIDNLSGLVYRCKNDPEWTMEFISEGCIELSGYHPDDLINNSTLSFNDLIHPDDRALVWEKIQNAITKKRPYQIVYRIRTAQGTIKWVWEKGRGIFGESDTLVALEGFITDITARKLTEEKLRESEQRYKRLVNAVTNYIYTIRMAGDRPIETEHGEGCLAVTGYTSAEYGSDPELWHKMIHPADKNTVMEHAGQLHTGKTAFPIEHRIIHKNGSIRWIRNTAVSRLDTMGQRVSLDGLIEDITERKMVEDQLRQMQRLESLGQIAGGVAHDYNNAIGAIMGFCTLAQMHTKPESPAYHYLEDILSVSDRATNITKSLLSFSRKQTADIKPIDLNNTVSIMGKLLLNFIGENIRLKLNLADKDLVINGDSGQLDQVMMNLATNARDAMPDGGSLIISTAEVELDVEFIRTHGYGACGRYALLSVEDTGAGIDAMTKERIFEPFFTTKEVGKGTGLGLSVTYGIIQQHNGFIDVYSEPGHGTVFKIYLPLVEAAAASIKARDRLPLSGGNETILVVEDEPSVRRAIKIMLESFGYQVIEAENGSTALDKFMLHKETIRLAIIDVIMPGKNGKETYDEMRRIAPDLKAIFTSGYASDVLTDKHILEEGLEFITKPASPREMLRKIREFLDRSNDPVDLP
jgi:PAS domain S-box-containing protein